MPNRQLSIYGDLDSMFLGNPQDLETHIKNAISVGLSLADRRNAKTEANLQKALEKDDFLIYLLGNDIAEELKKADAKDGWKKAETKKHVKDWVDEE